MSIKESLQYANCAWFNLCLDLKDACNKIKENPNQTKTTLAALLGITAGPALVDIALSYFSNNKVSIVSPVSAAEISTESGEISEYFLTSSDLLHLDPENQINSVVYIGSMIDKARMSPVADKNLKDAEAEVFPKIMSKTEFGQQFIDLSNQYDDSQFKKDCIEIAEHFGVKSLQTSVSAPSPVVQVSKPAELPANNSAYSPAIPAAKPEEKPVFCRPDANSAPSSTTLEQKLEPTQQYAIVPVGAGSSRSNVQIGAGGQYRVSLGGNDKTDTGFKTNQTNLNVSQGANNGGLNHYDAEKNMAGWKSQQVNVRAGPNSTNVNYGKQDRNLETGNNTNLRLTGNSAYGRTNVGLQYSIFNPLIGGYNVNIRRNSNKQVSVNFNSNEKHTNYRLVPVNNQAQYQSRINGMLDKANNLFNRADKEQFCGNYRGAKAYANQAAKLVDYVLRIDPSNPYALKLHK